MPKNSILNDFQQIVKQYRVKYFSAHVLYVVLFILKENMIILRILIS